MERGTDRAVKEAEQEVTREAAEVHRRRQLRVLDACLQHLEDAHERDEVRVSIALAAKVGWVMPSVIPGMPIRNAIELVLREQERHLLAMSDEVTDCYMLEAEGGLPPLALGESEARLLTARIKDASQQMALLLLEAYERRAAPALGYPTWEAYVQEEFGLSRSRSYELLDQGRVVRALRAATRMSGMPDISSRAAFDVKPYLNELIETIRDRAAGRSDQELPGIVNRAVQEIRSWARGEAPRRSAEAAPPARHDGDPSIVIVGHPSIARACDTTHLREAISLLVNMPPPAEAVATVLEQGEPQLDDLMPAVRWLLTFTQHWVERSGCADLSRELRAIDAWVPVVASKARA